MKDNRESELNLVRMASSPSKGRYMQASQFISKGTVVFVEDLLSHVVHHDKILRVCDSCLTYSHTALLNIHCNNCNWVYYCSEACKTKNEIGHKVECQYFSKLDRTEFEESYFYDAAKLMVRMMSRNLGRPEVSRQDNLSVDYNNFSIGSLAGHPVFLREGEAAKVIKTVTEILQLDEKGVKILEHLYCVEETNSFEMWGKGSCALALLSIMSFINHSCAPNLVRRETGTRYEFVAVKDIPEGTELNIAYLNIAQDYDYRQNYLSKIFHFDCTCERCTFEATNEKPLELDDYFISNICREPTCSNFEKPLSPPSSHLTFPLNDHCPECGWEKRMPHVWVKHEDPVWLRQEAIKA